MSRGLLYSSILDGASSGEKKETGYNPSNIIERDEYGSGEVMLWASISST